jgi:5'-3' exonuclease
MDKFARRTVRVTKEHNAECQRLLKLMGIPVVVVGPYIVPVKPETKM